MKVICINLKRRVDRWNEALKECEKIGVIPERFEAIEHENPVIGCALSHFKIMETHAYFKEPILVLEDDIKFINNAKEILDKYLKEIPADYDLAYLGGNLTTPAIRLSEHVAKINHIQSTHAYIVAPRFTSTIEIYQNYLGKPMDLIYAENIIPYHNCYITIPMIAVQRPSYSDIENKYVDYTQWMESRFYSNLVDKV